MDYNRCIKQLRDAGMIPTYGHQAQIRNMNRIAHHGTKINETTKHMVIKTIIASILRQKGDFYISEFEFRNRVVDILQIKDGEFVAYEVESVMAKLKDIIVEKPVPWFTITIDLKKVPDDINKAEKYLKSIVV